MLFGLPFALMGEGIVQKWSYELMINKIEKLL